jgi:glycosyltransferase family protein
MMKEQLKFYYWYLRTFPLRRHFPRLKIKGIIETLDDVIRHRKSISRFGDGEMRMIINKGKIVFQDESPELSVRLKEVLDSELDNLIVALPQPLASTKNMKRSSKYFWLGFLNLYSNDLSNLIDTKRKYGNSFISRFYMIFENKGIAAKTVVKLKEIWEKKEILIIEGQFSRLGVGNDLFENASDIKRIICPHKNAFSKYDEILNAAIQHGKNKLILIALGPTATVLSYDLAKNGLWALDVGHIDVEYMWMLREAETKIPIKGRYVSEARDITDYEIPVQYQKKYYDSIIHRIEIDKPHETEHHHTDL